jgi:hypothetical protein
MNYLPANLLISGFLPFNLRAALCAFKYTPVMVVRGHEMISVLKFHAPLIPLVLAAGSQ